MKPAQITIHQSSTSFSYTIEALEVDYKTQNYPRSNLGKYSPFHYSIDYKGNVVVFRKEEEKGFCFQDDKINEKSITVCFIGDFEHDMPLEDQVNALKNLITNIKNRWGELPVYLHRELEPEVNLPGSNITKKWLDSLLEIKGNRHSLSHLEDQVLLLKSEKIKIKEQLIKYQEEQKADKACIKESQDKLSNLKQELGKYMESSQEYERKVKVLEKKLEDNQKDLENALKLTGEREAEINNLKIDFKAKKQEFENVLRLVGRKEADASSLSAQLRSAKMELENVLKLAGNKEVEANNSRERILKRERKVKRLKMHLVAARKEAIQYRKRNEKLKDKLRKKSFWSIINRTGRSAPKLIHNA